MAKTVLIIDDSETVRNRVQRALAEREIFSRFLTAADGVEGFKLLLNNQVDLVLCDLVMPGIDGFKFLTLKQSKPELTEVPVILLTGQEDVRTKVRGLETGASDYLTKPFHDEELVARVKVHLKIKQLQDELKDQNQRLEVMSNTDGLTKITNRRHFMEVFELEFLRAERYRASLSYVMIDIDHFKKINDKHGHQVGDQALIAVAGVLKEGLRKHDIAARYGGEEFALLLPETDLAGAQVVAERYRKRIEDTPVASAGDSLHLTASLGISCFPREDVSNIDDLIRLADAALYEAKNQGRNRVVVAG
ncbi:MAG: diguanylate cyclase [Bdellovibrionota bacterium]